MPKSPVLKTRSSKASASKKRDHAARPVTPVAAKSRVHTPLAQMKHTPVEPPVPPMPTEARFGSSAAMTIPKVTEPTVTTPRFSQVGKDVRIEPIRFSSLQNGDSRNMRVIGRILLFIVAVIVVGVGLIMFVQNYINQQSTNTTTSTASSTPTVPQIDGVSLATTITQDAEATDVPETTEYISAEVNVGSAANAEDDIQISTLAHTVYQSFTRFTWGFTGITKGAPAVKVSANGDRSQIVLSFADVTPTQSQLVQKINLPVGAVTSMETNETADGNTTVTLTISEPSRYVVSLAEDQTSVTLNIKTDTQLRASASSSATVSSASSSAISTTVSSSVSSSTSSSSVSGEVNYENDPSTSVQYIVSESTTNTELVNQIIYYQDFGPRFRFSWGFAGVGPDSTPNAKAEIIKEGNQNYLQVTIEGLARDAFQYHGIETETFEGVNTQYANVYEVRLHQREGKTSVYRFKMRRVANYQLLATLTRDGRQLLTVDAYD